jgi:SAM-dependent methyltransferase
MQILPGVDYIVGSTEQMGSRHKWDVVVMHNVTEHLMHIEKDFELFHRLLKPRGKIIFHHPNYYAWGGHHMRPRTIDEIDPSDPTQLKYMDWKHVRFDPEWPEKILLKQNRIRPGELRALTERFFDIITWEPKLSTRKKGIDRLTPQILARYAGEFSRDDLATQSILCVAAKRTS